MGAGQVAASPAMGCGPLGWWRRRQHVQVVHFAPEPEKHSALRGNKAKPDGGKVSMHEDDDSAHGTGCMPWKRKGRYEAAGRKRGADGTSHRGGGGSPGGACAGGKTGEHGGKHKGGGGSPGDAGAGGKTGEHAGKHKGGGGSPGDAGAGGSGAKGGKAHPAGKGVGSGDRHHPPAKHGHHHPHDPEAALHVKRDAFEEAQHGQRERRRAAERSQAERVKAAGGAGVHAGNPSSDSFTSLASSHNGGGEGKGPVGGLIRGGSVDSDYGSQSLPPLTPVSGGGGGILHLPSPLGMASAGLEGLRSALMPEGSSTGAGAGEGARASPGRASPSPSRPPGSAGHAHRPAPSGGSGHHSAVLSPGAMSALCPGAHTALRPSYTHESHGWIASHGAGPGAMDKHRPSPAAPKRHDPERDAAMRRMDSFDTAVAAQKDRRRTLGGHEKEASINPAAAKPKHAGGGEKHAAGKGGSGGGPTRPTRPGASPGGGGRGAGGSARPGSAPRPSASVDRALVAGA